MGDRLSAGSRLRGRSGVVRSESTSTSKQAFVLLNNSQARVSGNLDVEAVGK